MTNNSPHPPDSWGIDDDDDDGCDGATGLDGLPEYPDADDDVGNDWIGAPADDGEPLTDEDDEEIETLLVTASNPSRSVTAVSFIDGRVFQVQLSSQVTRMTEQELTDEIVMVSNLSRRQAEAAQHYLIATVMNELGHDPAATHAFLEHTIGLPTPGTVIDEKARMYAEHNATGD